MKKIIILQHNGFFTQHLKEYQNIDMSLVCSELENAGYKFEFLEYKHLADYHYKVDDSAIYWTGSHQNISVKHYINDVLTARFMGRNNLVPGLDTVLAHENKGLMGMLAAEKALPFVAQNYHISSVENPSLAKFPFVFKALGGAGSKGVSLIHDRKQLLKALRTTTFLEASVREMREGVKNRLRKWLNRKEQADYLTQQARFCEQAFVPELSSDYKVLVFWDKVYVLKRAVREGDFRASGSGKFEVQQTIDSALAELAIDCRKKLNAPYCSLDFVTLPTGEYQLIEFQTCHFGPYTQISATCFYNDTSLKLCADDEDFERNMTYAMLKYLNEATI